MPVEVAVVAVFASVGFYVMVIAGLWLLSRSKNERARLQAEVQSKLIERFNSAPELIEFLQSSAGQKFVTGVDAVPRMMARERIIASVRTSIVFATMGVAFLSFCISDYMRNEFFMFVGTMLLAIGLAFLIAALASVKLGRSFGLINGATHDPLEPRASE